MTLTPQEITERLRDAARAVDDAELAEDLRALAFERALDAVGLAAEPVPSSPRPDRQAPAASLGEHDVHARSGPLAEIARRFDLSLDAIERVYEEEDGEIRLAIKRSMLPDVDRKAAATRHLALLVVAGRQAAGLEEETSFGAIREECQSFGVLDSANFATEIGKLDFRVRGGRNSKTAKANRHHFEDAAGLIRGILGPAE